jgi:MFS family permease
MTDRTGRNPGTGKWHFENPPAVAAGASDMQRAIPHGRVFRGWYVVASAFAITFLGYGGAYTFGTFVESLQRDFGASRGSVSLAFSLAGFLYFALGAVSGPLADRWGARRLAVFGMVSIAAGLALAGAAPTLAGVYAAYGLGMGLGIGCAYVPAVGAVQRWFVRRRGVASGVAVSGIGVGTLVMPLLAAHLIDAVGWRQTYFILAGIVGVLGVGLSLLLEDDPSVHGLHADGESPAPVGPGPRAAGIGLRAAVGSPMFAGLYAACLACSFGVFVPFVHLVPYARAHGLERPAAVLLIGIIGIGSTLGRFCLGGLADRMGRQAFLVGMYVGMALALAVWVGATGFWTLALFATLFGLFYGGWVAILPAVVADRFGTRSASGIIGVLYTSVAVGTLIGPSATGYVFDTSHSYTLPIIASAGANVCAAVITAFMSRVPAAAGEKPGRS